MAIIIQEMAQRVSLHFAATGLVAVGLAFASPVTASDARECTAGVMDSEATLALMPVAAQMPKPPDPLASMVAPALAVLNTFRGKASYYGREFAGRLTAAGERFNPHAMTMAHRSLPFGTMVRVTNLLNHMSVMVRVNDRGPFVGGRVGDLSAGAAQALGMLGAGVVDALFEVVGPPETLR